MEKDIDKIIKEAKETMRMLFFVTRPWKIKENKACGFTPEYVRGWNDCIKEKKKREEKLIRHIQNIGKTKKAE